MMLKDSYVYLPKVAIKSWIEESTQSYTCEDVEEFVRISTKSIVAIIQAKGSHTKY